MTQKEKVAALLEDVILRCFSSMYNPHARMYPELAGLCPISKEPIKYTPWNELDLTNYDQQNNE